MVAKVAAAAAVSPHTSRGCLMRVFCTSAAIIQLTPYLVVAKSPRTHARTPNPNPSLLQPATQRTRLPVFAVPYSFDGSVNEKSIHCSIFRPVLPAPAVTYPTSQCGHLTIAFADHVDLSKLGIGSSIISFFKFCVTWCAIDGFRFARLDSTSCPPCWPTRFGIVSFETFVSSLVRPIQFRRQVDC